MRYSRWACAFVPFLQAEHTHPTIVPWELLTVWENDIWKRLHHWTAGLQLDSNDSEYTVKCSFLELYNEESSDLLAVGDAREQKLRMLEDKNGVVVQVSKLC